MAEATAREGKPETRRDVIATVAALSALAALCALAWAALFVREPPALTLPTGALALVLAASTYHLQTRTLVLPWRGQGAAMHLDEVAIFVGLLALPPILLPAIMMPATFLAQLARRRPLVKVAFNVATQLLSIAAAAGIFVALSRIAHPALAGVAATAWHTVFTNLCVAFILARVEREPVATAIRERFSVEIVLQAALGASVGLVLLALWRYHPLALLAAIPFLLLARQFAEYRLRSERVLRVHDRMTRLSDALARATGRDELAHEVLAAVGDLFRASRATLVLVPRHGQSHASWTRTFPYEPRAWGQLDVPLPGADGMPLGVISVDLESAPGEAGAENPRALLRLLAQEAGAAFERFDRARAAPVRRA